jgi:hypothetical protein
MENKNNDNNKNDGEKQGFFSDKSRMLGTSLVLVLLSFFIIVYGLQQITWLYWTGVVLLFAGFILAPLSRYTAAETHKKEEEDKKEEKGEEEGPGEEESKQGKTATEEGKEKGIGKREGD